MSTERCQSNLSRALFGKARLRVLSTLFGRPDGSMYLRQLAREIGMGLGAVQNEVRRLTEAGILLRSKRGNQVYYQANRTCPIYAELRSLMLKTAGAADLIGHALIRYCCGKLQIRRVRACTHLISRQN
ncbi:MAG: winged helix-turn-helix transcriptional regulator [Pirellulales bacterium]|nr:winged helix-turn-helix transcriptional regulator [Pirellulales bacterium]